MLSQGGSIYEGALSVKAVISGASLKAQLSGTGGISPAPLSGLVLNGRCRLVDQANTLVYEGTCDETRFIGTVKSTPTSRVTVDGSFDLRATQYTDVSIREAKAASAQLIEDQKRADLQKRCDGGSLTACVELDTR